MWRFLKKLGIEMPYDPAIPLLDIHSEETRIERDTSTLTFIAALFTIARMWKQPRCLSADKYIRKLWYIHTMEYYSDIKRSTFESILIKWMNLEPIIQNEVVRKTNTVYSHVYMKSRRMVPTILRARQQRRHGCKEHTSGLSGRRRGWDDLRE